MKNEEISEIMKEIMRTKWRFTGHIEWLNDDRWTRRLFVWRLRGNNRNCTDHQRDR